jgi:hypothetical protein
LGSLFGHDVHFLSRERKTNQKKTPVRRFYPALLAGLRSAVKLAALKQSQRFFRTLLRCSARLNGNVETHDAFGANFVVSSFHDFVMSV